MLKFTWTEPNIISNIYINKALELYHKYCPVNRNYPDQIHKITKALQLDNSSLVAIILCINRQHDFNLEKHKHHFNKNIIYLVDVINKLSTTHDKPYAEQYIHFNKLLLTINFKLQEMAVLTSLVPLLHKVSIFNLEYNNTDAQHISEIITNCYIPYLLSYTTHNELAYLLQDLCFKIQYPEERNRILHYMHWLYPDIDNIIHNIEQQFGNIFRKLNIKASLSYRIKSPYSIWIKTLVKDIHITALNDILAFRAIVPNKKACYDVSKLIHLHYNTITSQFVDYIRYPKNNGYQSIHIVISDSNKGNIELQIRSTTMHRQTQYGSAHHTYKANKYYVSRTNNNVSVILCNITLSYSNRILNVEISIVTITGKIINNVSTYNTFASFTQYTQHSTNFVGNDITTCTLFRTITPEYINYYTNNLSLFIKDINSNIIDYHFALNINRNVSNILEYKVVPLEVAQIASNSILLENNNVFIKIAYKPTLYEDAFPVTKTYTKRHEDSNIRSIFESSLPKTDITTTTCNISSFLPNNQDIAAQYSKQSLCSNTSSTFNTKKDRILDLLIDPKKIQNQIDHISQFDKDILLNCAARFGNSQLVRYLSEYDANPITRANNGQNALHVVAGFGNLDLVKLLIPQDINIIATTDHGDTVLHCAIKSSNLDLVRNLVEVYRANINIQNNLGETPLHYAICYSQNLELVEFLIKHGADVNAKTNDSFTPLHYAIRSHNIQLVDWLIQIGADINVKTTNNKTLLHYALEYNHFDIVKILIQCGIKIDPDTYDNICHNDLFRYIEYTNTTPQQSMLENDSIYETNKILNPAPESSDIHNLSSNICMDITPLSLDQIEYNITNIPKSIDDTEIPLHTLEQKVQFYKGTPCYHHYSYQEYYQFGSMAYNAYQYQDAILYYDYAINIINNTNYAEYHDKEKYYIIKLLGNIYVDKGNALCMQSQYDEGTMHYNSALLTYSQLTGQDNIEFLIALAKYNFGSAMLEQAIEQYKQGYGARAQAYYNKGLELYKPAEQYGLCNVDELQKETRGYLNHDTIGNNYISNHNYNNADILYNSMLGEIMVCI